MMRKIFRADQHQTEFSRLGYLHLPLLSKAEVAELHAYYFQHGLKPQGEYGFHISLDHLDRRKVIEIGEKITSIIWPRARKLFDRGKVFTASYVVKEPGLQNIVPPHQDWTFVDESLFCSFTLWVALQDVNIDNGALCILPGSTEFFNFPRASPSPQARSPLTDFYFDIFPYMRLIEMKAGDVLIFDNRLIHASPPNNSDKPRIAAGIGVTHEEAQLIHYYQVPGSDPVQLEGFKVDKPFFNLYNNTILSELYDSGNTLKDYDSMGRILRKVPELNTQILQDLISGVEGWGKDEILVRKLAALYNYNEDGSKQNISPIETTSGPVSDTSVKPDPNRTFWETYTMKNIIAEVQHRIRALKAR
jgi:hypothetical protein